MVSFVYKWVNVSTGEYYTGVHRGEFDDGYIGSGKVFLAKYNKHPKKFKRTILGVFENYDDALKLEAELVNRETIKEEKCLNLKIGGEGGGSPWKHDTERVNKRRERMMQLWSDIEYRQNVIKSMKKNWTDEYKEKRLNKGTIGFPQEKINRKKAVETRKKGSGYQQNFGKKRTEKSKKLMSEKAKNREHIKCPHCGMSGATPQMKRWHFENCKQKDSFYAPNH